MPKTKEEKLAYHREYYHKNKKLQNVKLTRNKFGRFENKQKVILDKDKIIDLYINKKLSTDKLANIYNVDKTIIRRLLLQNHIKIRNIKEAMKLASGSSNSKWKGYEKISGAKWRTIKNGAKKRNIKFKITIQEAWELYVKQDKKCALTGVVLTFPDKDKQYTEGEWTASLDRIDSKKGYIQNNIRWVHKWINCMKWDLSDKEFFIFCKQVVKYNNL